LLQFVAALLALAVVDAGVVVRRNGGNFAYTVNSPYYVPHALAHATPSQLMNPDAADVKVFKPLAAPSLINPHYPLLAQLINPVKGKTTTETEEFEVSPEVEEVAPSPYLFPATYDHGIYPFGFASNLVHPGFEPYPSVAIAEQLKEVDEVAQVTGEAEVNPVEPEDVVVVQAE
jgi:hypothetical protein